MGLGKSWEIPQAINRGQDKPLIWISQEKQIVIVAATWQSCSYLQAVKLVKRMVLMWWSLSAPKVWNARMKVTDETLIWPPLQAGIMI